MDDHDGVMEGQATVGDDQLLRVRIGQLLVFCVTDDVTRDVIGHPFVAVIVERRGVVEDAESGDASGLIELRKVDAENPAEKQAI